MQLLPTKLIGVIADHGSFPIERIAVDHGGDGRWVGSVGHEDLLRMTDLREVFEDEDKDENSEKDEDRNDEEVDEESPANPSESVVEMSDNEIADTPRERKRKRKKEKDALVGRKKKGRNEVDAEPSFFHGL